MLYIEKTFTSVCLSCFKTSQILTPSETTSRNNDVLLICVFTHLRLPFTKRKRSLLYISAWAFCVARSRKVGIAKAWNTGRVKVRFPRFFYIYTIMLEPNKSNRPGESGVAQWQRMTIIHVGQLIENTLRNQGRTVTWFAAQLCCTRPNVYKIFSKESIDTYLLWRISCILQHNFFHDLSAAVNTELISTRSWPFLPGKLTCTEKKPVK